MHRINYFEAVKFFNISSDLSKSGRIFEGHSRYFLSPACFDGTWTNEEGIFISSCLDFSEFLMDGRKVCNLGEIFAVVIRFLGMGHDFSDSFQIFLVSVEIFGIWLAFSRPVKHFRIPWGLFGYWSVASRTGKNY